MELIKLTEPDRKTEVYINKDLIFSFFHSQQFACTLVQATGGGMMKVSETPEEIKTKLKKENTHE